MAKLKKKKITIPRPTLKWATDKQTYQVEAHETKMPSHP